MFFAWKWKISYTEVNRKLLKKGKFVFLPNMRTLVEKSSIKTIGKLFPKCANHSMKHRLKWLVSRIDKVKNRNDGEEFQASAVYFSNTGRREDSVIKFFDYDKKQVLTICQKAKHYEAFFEKRQSYSRYYEVPKLIEYNEEEKTYVEEILEKRPFNDQNKRSVYEYLAKKYTSTFKKNAPSKVICDYVCPQALRSVITEVPEELSVFLQHGDLSIDNFIWDGEKLTFIDFEHQDNYTLYYDLMFLIANSYIVNKDSFGVEMFENQAFDEYFKEIFCNSKTPVKDVVIAFVLMFHERRIKHLTGLPIYDAYMRLFERLIKSAQGR